MHTGLYYFIEGQINQGRFAELGLDARLPRGPREVVQIGRDDGPEGKPGLVLHNHTGGLPKPIDWHDTGNGYWLGWHAGYPPKPEQLERGLTVRGFYVPLCDDNEWLIPLVLPCTELDPERAHGLPQAPVRLLPGLEGRAGLPSGNGRPIQWTHKREYDGLVRAAEELLAAFDDPARTGPEIFHDRGVSYVLQLLQVGYRIHLDEVLALELLDQDTAAACAMVSFDINERLRARCGEAVPELAGA